MNKPILKCYFDGACAPRNPFGHMGMGAHANLQEKEIYAEYGYEPKSYRNSNNVAEYLALEMLLDWLLEQTEEYWIHIHGDSKLVVKQMRGNWKINEGLYVDHALRCKSKMRKLKRRQEVRIDWIGRDYNQRADELSNQAFFELKIVQYEEKEPGRQWRPPAIR